MGGCFKETRPAGKPRSKWQEAVWWDILGLPRIWDGKTEARRKGGGRRSGRPWHENGPNSTQEEEDEEEELVATLGAEEHQIKKFKLIKTMLRMTI
jgi:hypothetical protein